MLENLFLRVGMLHGCKGVYPGEDGARNTKGGCITVLLTSCLTSFEPAV
jgi:hypothetical protein